MRVPLPPVTLPDHLAAVAEEYADGTRTPAEPRNAATVVLLRDSAAGPEAYLLMRQKSMDFAAGMAVFPGGGVDPRDHALAEELWAGPSVAEWASVLGVDETAALALVCAAVRETFEESGVLLAGPSADTVVADTTGAEWEADRVALEARELSLTDFLSRRGLVLRTDLLGAWSAWLTPVFEPKRYRTWFFVAQLPEGQRTRDVSSESSSVEWLSVTEAPDRADAGTLALMPPTYLTCVEVGQHRSVADVLAATQGRRVSMFTPTAQRGENGYTLTIPESSRALLADRLATRPPRES